MEVILCEVSFFDSGGQGYPVFTDILDHLRGAGFVVYDFATLSARLRDQRLRMGDVVFVHERSALLADVAWV